jgi:hypothetical protein
MTGPGAANPRPPNPPLMLKRLIASLSAQGLRPGLIVDLTGRGPGEDAHGVRLWRRAGSKDAFAAGKPAASHAGLFRPDGALDPQGLFEAVAPSRAAGEPRVLAVPQALAGPATLAELARAGVDAFAVVATGRTEAGDWAPIVRNAFDAGYVSLAATDPADTGAVPRQLTFLRSGLVQAPNRLGGLTRGVVSMTTLGQNGRFANQLMQYAYVKLYALRHGLRPVVPHWAGADLYKCRDAKPDGADRDELRFFAFDNDDLHLWRVPDPPVDIDLWGYFQELPACWKPHRQLLRRLYALPRALAGSLERRLAEATDKGRRDLVAIHVRRGDYKTLHRQGLPWYRPVPEEWYAAWLRRVLPGLRDPLVYVATDEPEAVLPRFAEFEPIGTGAFEVPDLAADALDFEVLRRAEHLAIANSSFSRMAAILAPEAQASVCPDFEKETFVAYEPWIDNAFWGRFEAEPKAEAIMGYGLDAQGARALAVRGELGHRRREAETLRENVATLTDYLGEREKALRELRENVATLTSYLGERETALLNYEEEVRRWAKRVFELEAEQEQSRREREADVLRFDEQSRCAAEDLERGRKQAGDLERRLAEREAANRALGEALEEQSSRNADLERRFIERKTALRDYETTNRKLGETLEEQSRRHSKDLAHWRKQASDLEKALRKSEVGNRELARALDEHTRREAEAIGRWRAEVEGLKAERNSLAHRVAEHEDRLQRADAEADEARRRLEAMAYDQEAARAQLRRLAEIENEPERQRRLVRRQQEAESALRTAALDERTREDVVPKAQLDRALALAQLPSVRDYLKLLVFWPVGWLLRQAARPARARIPVLVKKLEDLAELIDRRQYRSFVEQFGRSLARAPRRIGRRALRRSIPASLADPAASAEGGPAAATPGSVPPDAPVPAKVYVKIAPRALDGPVVLVLGSAGPDGLAATLESLASQTLRPSDIRVSPGEDGFACRPDDLVCIAAAGARLDPTALELLAAALLSVPGCKFATASGAAAQAGDEQIAACLIPGRIWQVYGRPALAMARSEGFPDALGAAMQGVLGQGLLLPLPLAAWASKPGSGFDISAWPAVRATPDRG